MMENFGPDEAMRKNAGPYLRLIHTRDLSNARNALNAKFRQSQLTALRCPFRDSPFRVGTVPLMEKNKQ